MAKICNNFGKPQQKHRLKAPHYQVTIDALNQTPRALAHYIKHLAKDPKASSQFTEWRRHYTVEVEEWPCLLCRHVRNAKASSGQSQRQKSNTGRRHPGMLFDRKTCYLLFEMYSGLFSGATITTVCTVTT